MRVQVSTIQTGRATLFGRQTPLKIWGNLNLGICKISLLLYMYQLIKSGSIRGLSFLDKST